MHEPLPRLRTILWRGLRRRCPHCGRGKLLRGWTALYERCPVCGFKFVENQGDLWGWLLLVDRALFLFPLVVMIYFRLYNPHSIWFWCFAGALVFTLVYTLPHRTGMNVAIEYFIRRRWGDLSEQSASKSDWD